MHVITQLGMFLHLYNDSSIIIQQEVDIVVDEDRNLTID